MSETRLIRNEFRNGPWDEESTDMQWIRGGTWRLDPDDNLAVLVVGQTNPGPPSLGRNPLPGADYFLDMRSKWQQEVGYPAGLECYDLSGRTVAKFLADARTVIRKFPDGDLHMVEREGTGELFAVLLDLLRAHGPLTGVSGIFHVFAEAVGGDQGPTGAVDLEDFFSEARVLTAFAELTEEPEKGRAGEFLPFASAAAMREVRTTPKVVDGTILLDSDPVSLRAFLWLWLFRRYRELPYGKCEECLRTFELGAKPGPYPRFCFEHGSAASRQRRFRKKQRAEAMNITN